MGTRRLQGKGWQNQFGGTHLCTVAAAVTLGPQLLCTGQSNHFKACFVLTATEPLAHHITLHSVQDQQGFVETPLC